MKRTDMDRIDRELKRARKKQQIADKLADRKDQSAGGFAKALFDALQFDEQHIFNDADDESLLEIILEMKEALPEKQWEPVVRKAIRLTGVEDKQGAWEVFRSLLEA
jgi:hypothetical protein